MDYDDVLSKLNDLIEKLEESNRRAEVEKEKGHVYPATFPGFIYDDSKYNGTHVLFAYGPYGDQGVRVWDDYAEAKRRWEAFKP